MQFERQVPVGGSYDFSQMAGIGGVCGAGIGLLWCDDAKG